MTAVVGPLEAPARRRPPRRGWRGPRYEGEVPTLGYGVLEWMVTYLPSPRDETRAFEPTDEQARMILLWYAIHPETGGFLYRRWLQMRAKGWGKSPIVGALELAELGAARESDSAPVVFDGWDAAGEPVGRPWGTGGLPPAWVQIAAVSEDQTANTYSAIYQMLTGNDHRAARLLGIDDGRTRLYLRGRPGKLEPVTASSGSREGQPVTAAVLDETHLYRPDNGGTKLARTVRRNAAKMNGRTIETSNAPILGQESVAEHSLAAARRGAPGVLLDAARPAVTPEPTWDDARLKAALGESYGDSWWVGLDRLVADIRDPDTPWDDALRFFFNIPTAGTSRVAEPATWTELAQPRDVEPGSVIALGFKGSINQEPTVLRACTPDGYRWTIRSWERPEGAEGRDWQVPRTEVHETIAETFATYTVAKMLAAPEKWWTEVEAWQVTYGEEIVLGYPTNSAARMAPAIDRWRTGIATGHPHDGDPLVTAHVESARLKPVHLKDRPDDDRTMYVLERGEDGRPISAAIADVLAYEAAMTAPEPVDAPEPFLLLGGR